jgi:hypothetical protein
MGRSRFLTAVAALALVAVALAAAVHLYSWLSYRASFPPGSLGQRRAAIERALAMEPWNRAYGIRKVYLDAELLEGRGDNIGAYHVVRAALDTYPGDAGLRRYAKELYPKFYNDSSGKAHQQHGHEGPGGTLTPGQVER